MKFYGIFVKFWENFLGDFFVDFDGKKEVKNRKLCKKGQILVQNYEFQGQSCKFWGQNSGFWGFQVIKAAAERDEQKILSKSQELKFLTGFESPVRASPESGHFHYKFWGFPILSSSLAQILGFPHFLILPWPQFWVFSPQNLGFFPFLGSSLIPILGFPNFSVLSWPQFWDLSPPFWGSPIFCSVLTPILGPFTLNFWGFSYFWGPLSAPFCSFHPKIWGCPISDPPPHPDFGIYPHPNFFPFTPILGFSNLRVPNTSFGVSHPNFDFPLTPILGSSPASSPPEFLSPSLGPPSK